MAKSRLANDTKYDSLISSASNRYGVPVWLIKGIIAQESRFSATATRTEAQLKDASIGLMQILGATAKAVGYYGTLEGLQIPNVNIEYGVKFLSTLVAMFPHDIERAISAYNAGPGNAKRWPNDAQEKGFCLARDSNGVCVRWYRFKAGEFGNQPYVQDVLDYASNYGYTGAVPAMRGSIIDNSGRVLVGPRPGTMADVTGGSSSTAPAPVQPPATLPSSSPVIPTRPPIVATLPEPAPSTPAKVGATGLAIIGAAIAALVAKALGRK